ncbi:regulatory GntR family protein [Actinocrispum wychmicini]|uniref:Regulatory GntR family protein n=1 Tax=Actinocrispum wychmicini TaxID=1213861 RepID=A0A4V2S725_9PSEU|nr:regulatory GntR family protein [Actinocrispum wychmicini]
MRVYAGTDPVTHHQHYLTRTIPHGPTAARDAETARQRLVTQVQEGRHPRTNATLTLLLDRHLAILSASPRTRTSYRGYLRNHITPLIGHFRIGAVTPEILDSFYAELARCRDHCGTPADRRITNKATPTTARSLAGKQKCHACRPLSPTTIRKVHFLISAAYNRARRWGWIHTSPTPLASPPSPPRPNPQPPTPDEVTRILTEAWPTPDLGVLIWLAIITGARRGELCAQRWTDFHPDRRTQYITRSITQDGRHTLEKDTKNHQQRHTALDPDTTALLAAYRNHRETLAANHGLTLPPDAFMFSPAPDGSRCLLPATLSQRYRRLVTRLGIHTTLHKLRHFNATELILANINIRTVASRLGHANTSLTLNTYTAWISEADQHATTALTQRIPVRLTPPPRHHAPPQQPNGIYQRIAHDLHEAITNGTYPVGSPLPTNQELAEHYHASTGTIHRAITHLAEHNLITVSRGHRATVLPHPTPVPRRSAPTTPSTAAIPFPLPVPPSPQPRPRRIRRPRIARTPPRPHIAGRSGSSPATAIDPHLLQLAHLLLQRAASTPPERIQHHQPINTPPASTTPGIQHQQPPGTCDTAPTPRQPPRQQTITRWRRLRLQSPQ